MSESTVTVSESKTVKPAAPLKLMVIDSNTNTRHHLVDTLRGLEIVEFVSDRGSPHSILDILSDNPVDVVIFDENPGGGDVFEIVKAIKSKAVGAKINFILMAETINDEVKKKGREAGIKGFLPKPYRIAEIEQALVDAAGAAPEKEAVPAKVPDALRETLDKLRKVSLFSGFSDPELVRLLKICRTRPFKAGSYVFREGEKGYSLYVLVAGRLEIRRKIDGEDKVLVEMRPGDCFGEMAIIDDEPRMADAVAASDCMAIEVNESVINNNEDIISLKLVRQIAILLAKKLRKS